MSTKHWPREPLTLGKLIRVCPGGRHGYYESPRGPVRKQLPPELCRIPVAK